MPQYVVVVVCMEKYWKFTFVAHTNSYPSRSDIIRSAREFFVSGGSCYWKAIHILCTYMKNFSCLAWLKASSAKQRVRAHAFYGKNIITLLLLHIFIKVMYIRNVYASNASGMGISTSSFTFLYVSSIQISIHICIKELSTLAVSCQHFSFLFVFNINGGVTFLYNMRYCCSSICI